MLGAMKRSRAPNFTMPEIIHLLRLVEKYPVIENKKMDGATLKEKHEAWQMLAFEYNSHANFYSRTPEHLLACYKNQKKKLKKAHSSDKMTVRGPSLVNTVEELGQNWSNVAEALNPNIPEQMACNQLVKEVKEEVCTEESPPPSPYGSSPVLPKFKTPNGPSSEEDGESMNDQQHMQILPIEFPLENSQQPGNDKIPDFAKNKQNQDIQRVHIMKKLIESSLESEKKGNKKKISHSFREFADEKKDLVKAQKALVDLQIQHQQLEIRLTEEKLDFERKKNEIELDFLKQKYELELNYLRNKNQD